MYGPRGEQIFVLQRFNSDPHPGNICLGKDGKIGLLDWGQVIPVSSHLLVNFARMNRALRSRNESQVLHGLKQLGVVLRNPHDVKSASDIGVTMLDTRVVPGYVLNPFKPESALKKNSVTKLPSDLYFLVRCVQLIRGISYGFGVDYSLADSWAPYAEKILQEHEKMR